MPFAALECVEGEVYLVDGEIGDPAGVEDDDLISVISAAAGRQTDELRVGGDDELQLEQFTGRLWERFSRELTSASNSSSSA